MALPFTEYELLDDYRGGNVLSTSQPFGIVAVPLYTDALKIATVEYDFGIKSRELPDDYFEEIL